MQRIYLIISVSLFSYIFGSIPFGVIAGKIYKVDITKVGSKNMGTTNVLRALGVVPALLVFTGDFLKGLLPVTLALLFGFEHLFVVIIGLIAIIGHTFPVFLKFKGGRGVATGLGVLLALTPDVFLLAAALALIIIGFTRYVSLASVLVSAVVPVSMYFWNKPLEYVVFTGVLALFIMLKHIPNIKRLLKGEERKVGEKVG